MYPYTVRTRSSTIGEFAGLPEAVLAAKEHSGRVFDDCVVWFKREVRAVVQTGGDAIMVTPAGWAVVTADDEPCLDLDAVEAAIVSN